MNGQCHKLPVNDFMWVEETFEFKEDFIKSYNDESDERYFPEVDVHCPENLNNFHNDFTFLSERMKIEKVEKVVVNLHDKIEYVIHIGSLKQTLKAKISLEKRAWNY